MTSFLPTAHAISGGCLSRIGRFPVPTGPYKPPRTHEDAIRIIQEVAGTQLDQELAEIFVKIPKEELVRCMPEDVKY